ncbi:MAG: hypothetical protein ABFS24_03100 [Pseudomonadota bacterium]
MRLVNLLTTNKNILSGLAIVALTVSSATAFAKNDKELFNPNTPSLTVVNSISDVQGYVGGFGAENIIYPIAGDVYATVTDDDAGVTQGAYVKEGSISATVLLSYGFFDLLGDWTLIPNPTIPWTMSDDFAMIINGTTFSFEEKLDGRAFPHLGPVEAYDPENPTLAVRMSGCAGVRADDAGDYAGKVGTLCLNGTFTFDGNFNGHGVSNCSIAIHDPQPGFPVITE